MSNSNKKRITVYLDLDIEPDNQIWEYLKGKRKTETIRSILANHINGVPTVPTNEKLVEDENNKVIDDEKDNPNKILDEELDVLNDFIK